MSISTVIATSLSGMQAGINRVAIAGDRVAMNTGNAASLATNVVEQMSGSHQVKMSANVIKAADEMLGSIINVRV